MLILYKYLFICIYMMDIEKSYDELRYTWYCPSCESSLWEDEICSCWYWSHKEELKVDVEKVGIKTREVKKVKDKIDFALKWIWDNEKENLVNKNFRFENLNIVSYIITIEKNTWKISSIKFEKEWKKYKIEWLKYDYKKIEDNRKDLGVFWTVINITNLKNKWLYPKEKVGYWPIIDKIYWKNIKDLENAFLIKGLKEFIILLLKKFHNN